MLLILAFVLLFGLVSPSWGQEGDDEPPIPVNEYGTPDMHERLLKPAIRGEKVASFALTEADAGSDLGAVKTAALLDGDEWVINGEKHYVSGAGDPRCKIMITMVKIFQCCREKPGNGPKVMGEGSRIKNL